MTYEYKLVGLLSAYHADFEELFNKLGAEGWELIAIDSNKAYFKRVIPKSTKNK